MRRAGLWVVVLAVSVLGAYSVYVVVAGVLRGPRRSDPAIYQPALGLIALVAIACALIVRRLLRGDHAPRRPVP